MRLDFIKPLIPLLPEVKTPTKTPVLREKIIWTSLVLLIFFIMYHIIPFGGELRGGQFIEFIQVVLASRTGTLLTIGIGPIILASIFLQLFAGAKIIDVNMQDPADKQLFSATQKVLGIALAFIESILFILPGVYLVPSTTLGIDPSILMGIIILQVALASVLLIFLDEVVSKYGIGSGISLFIAAGVSLAVVQGGITLIFGGGGIDVGLTVVGRLAQGGATAIPNAIISFLPIVFTFIIIIVSLYAEEVKVQIPLAFDRVRGFGSSFPVKLLYVSVLPVILTSALLLNVQLLARSFLTNANWMVGGTNIAQVIGYVGPDGFIHDGILYMITSFQNPLFIGYEGYLATLAGSTPIFGIPEFVHVILYALIYVTACVFFGRFWIEAAGMGPSAIADQITKTGMQVPGFRRDPRIIESILQKYISTITILGSLFVGLLAVLADLTGAIGGGTGILLTVGIIHKFYEDFKQQKLFEMYPSVQKFLEG